MLEIYQYDKADRRSSVKNYFHGFRGVGNCPNKQNCILCVQMHCLPSSKIRNELEDKTMENVTFDYKFYRIPKRFLRKSSLVT